MKACIEEIRIHSGGRRVCFSIDADLVKIKNDPKINELFDGMANVSPLDQRVLILAELVEKLIDTNNE